MDKPAVVRVSDSHLDQIPHDDVRAVLRVEPTNPLDDTQGQRFWVELHTATGVAATLDLARAGQLARALQHKLHVAATMEADQSWRVTPPR